MKPLQLTIVLILFLSTLAAQNEQAIQFAREELIATNEIHYNAYIDGDCEKAMELFAPEVKFYAMGKKAPSMAFLMESCLDKKRPFDPNVKITNEGFATSATSGYTVQTVAPNKDHSPTSIITKHWQKTPEGWKIVLMHTSSTLSNIGN